jgi:hypothetical protein
VLCNWDHGGLGSGDQGNECEQGNEGEGGGNWDGHSKVLLSLGMAARFEVLG